MDVITHEIVRTKEPSIRRKYTFLQKSLAELERKLEHERLVRLAEEQKRKEEEERKKREREEKERIENEKRIAEERRRRQQEADRLAEEARKKEQAELAERKQLEVLSTERKKTGLLSNKYWIIMVFSTYIILQIGEIFHQLNCMAVYSHGIIARKTI
jgi:Flp pilus assembly protein TadB